MFSAREGVEAQSETVWRQADRYGVPRIALINKLDREGADFAGTVGQIEQRLKAQPLVLQIPVGSGPPHVGNPFRGLIDLIAMEMLTFPKKEDVGAGEATLTDVVRSDIPPEMRGEADKWREKLVTALFDLSDEVAELALAVDPIPQ